MNHNLYITSLTGNAVSIGQQVVVVSVIVGM
jgi:hypothetical protein